MMDNLPRWSRSHWWWPFSRSYRARSFYAYRHFSRPVTLTIAVGSIDGGSRKLMSAIAARMAASKSGVRLKVIDKVNVLASTQAFEKGEDLAVVRPDLGDLASARTVVLVAYGVLLTLALPGMIKSIDDFEARPWAWSRARSTSNS